MLNHELFSQHAKSWIDEIRALVSHNDLRIAKS